jgi:hypothetical protein
LLEQVVSEFESTGLKEREAIVRGIFANAA